MNIPNGLTLFRVLLIPIFVLVYYLPWPWAHFVSAVIFALAAVTDWFDGYLARKLKQMSAFGRFLDPVADKLIIAVALVLIVGNYQHIQILLTIPAAIIIGREIVVSALREWMAEIGKQTSVAVSFLGKVKTTVQMIAVTGLLAELPGALGYLSIVASLILLWIAAFLTLWSMVMYLIAAYRVLV